jgi:hypothetical protein
MNQTVYVETTIVSYLTAWPTDDVERQAQQVATPRWWDAHRPLFALYTSQFVLDEAAAGDATAASDRLTILNGLDLLLITPDVEPLAAQLLAAGALPAKARVDALHVAVATVNGMEFLLTWNCRHLANAALWRKIEQTCNAAGYEPPTICTPYELMGVES